MQVSDWSTTKEYFIKFFPESSDNNLLPTSYHSYRYGFISSNEQHFIVRELMVLHSVLAGFSFLARDLPSDPMASGNRFCNLGDFPEVIKAANMRVMPDSNYSTIVMAISTFSWGIYVVLLLGRFLLEKKLLQVVPHRKISTAKGLAPSIQKVLGGLICVVIFLLTIFGVYAFKHTKRDMDRYLVGVWEVMKQSLVVLLSFYIDMLKKTI